MTFKLPINPVMATAEQPDVWPDGSRVEKCNAIAGDGHPDGAKAVTIGSLGPVYEPGLGWLVGYFVEWDDMPGVSCFVTGRRLKLVEHGRLQ